MKYESSLEQLTERNVTRSAVEINHEIAGQRERRAREKEGERDGFVTHFLCSEMQSDADWFEPREKLYVVSMEIKAIYNDYKTLTDLHQRHKTN